MPLPEVIQSRQISASVRFDETTATLVDQYAAFIRATADDVVNKGLHYVFAKDRDSRHHRRHPSKPVPKGIAGVGSIESVRVGKP